MKNVDIIVSLMIVAIVLLMVLPVPDRMLDFFQILNITLSMIILFSTMYIRNALELSSFPTLLLVVTLFRLGLNVASTRLILLEGPKFQGRVIRTFGDFVVKGDYVVGLIVFFILVIIQFIVITRGAERIAEVAARFTLDAMPGKQMSVDADLNSGLITEEEARKRREDIRREADFYGAMDGASKFVRGDAIASIIIVFINIIGGLLIGMLRHGMSLAEAAQEYVILTVGDGLAAQIPALLVSTATGIIVSRAASKENLGKDLVTELSRETKVLLFTGGVLIFLGIFTPIPFFSAILGGALIFLAMYTSRAVPQEELVGPAPAERPGGPVLSTPEEVSEIIQSDTVEVEIGYGLIPLADPSQGGDLLDRITSIRKQLAFELGLVVSPIRVRDSVLLKPNEYSIKIRGSEVARYELVPNRLLAINPGTAKEKIPGIPTREPAFNLEAYWIEEWRKEEAQQKGYTVVDPPTVFATHLSEVLRRHADELLGFKELELLIEGLKEKFPKLVEDLIPDVLKPAEVKKVLQRLLKEGVSIRNLPTIFEILLESAEKSKDIDYLVESVRKALKRQIASMVRSEDGKIHAIVLERDLEQKLLESLKEIGEERELLLNPEVSRELMNKISNELGNLMKKGYQPVIVCSARVRPYFSRYVMRTIPGVSVISYDEIPDDYTLQIEGVVKL
ncbi:flagellar biosynthesis protein FlhA [Thermotoga petrophila RKU-1]|uniref:Flagellar biosynthesis protein FlhA n=1 Tax=Thermotoga petrophila (strain ATCC BAA-488 / DSM 13995 / JCM 10881 / RKU-1) TaxID=390874 RepID=A5IIM5_THEP1|nr:flagellar biosynthesis protein FlhA [Thermotoga petrophila]ABQ46048.1 flagellar biosynthesis protein FlhA [Thermotoga petrophila RKU-1]